MAVTYILSIESSNSGDGQHTCLHNWNNTIGVREFLRHPLPAPIRKRAVAEAGRLRVRNRHSSAATMNAAICLAYYFSRSTPAQAKNLRKPGSRWP